MSVSNFNELKEHIGHKLECVMYGEQNVSIECVECNMVLFSKEKEEG